MKTQSFINLIAVFFFVLVATTSTSFASIAQPRCEALEDEGQRNLCYQIACHAAVAMYYGAGCTGSDVLNYRKCLKMSYAILLNCRLAYPSDDLGSGLNNQNNSPTIP